MYKVIKLMTITLFPNSGEKVAFSINDVDQLDDHMGKVNIPMSYHM